MGTRAGAGRAGNGAGPDPELFADSGSEPESDSGEEEPAVPGDRRGVKRERSDREAGQQSAGPGTLAGGYGGLGPGAPGARPGKKTRGRVKIKMEFIDNKLRRYTTFSKRKTGIMKKAYELSTLTGTQVLLLVASETGHVYTFATRKLQPMITSETGKALIQTCLNSPDSPPRADAGADQRMSATGFEEPDLTYQVPEAEGGPEGAKDLVKPPFGMQPSSSSSASSNGTLLKASAGVVLPGGFTLMSGASHTVPVAPGPPALHTPPPQPTTLLRLPATVSLSGGGASQQLQTIQVQASSQTSTNQSSSDIHSPASTAALPPSSSSSSVAGHMMYPGGHTVMYATPTSSLGNGGLAVLNTFSSTAPSHDPASVQQVFLTSLPPVAAQIPVSAVQLHPMVLSQQGGGGGSLAELQVVGQQGGAGSLAELQVVSLDVQEKDD